MPKLIDFELSKSSAKIVIERISGKLLIDAIEEGDKVDAVAVLKDILKSLADLEFQGLKHNDVRSWNIIYDGIKSYLIDYGVVSHKETDYDMVSLLWVISAIITKKREGYATKKKSLPEESIFIKNPVLKNFYIEVKKGQTSPAKIFEKIKMSQ